ncbi:MAG: beta-ketoacyl-[acyl-carrier-protein] synthase family protein [Bacteroidales bacterium]|nr:beta-ketoacyl-[acyl-carrier-protein] synthase family protein [Bacteroidales bacterium]
MTDKIVITGINIITALGLNIETSWQNLLAGKSGIKPIQLFDPKDLETRFAGQLPENFEDHASQYIKKRIAKQMTRVSRMCLTCAKEAVEKHQIPVESYMPERCAVILGVVNTGNSSIEKETDEKNTILKGMNNALSAWISLEFGFEGPNYTIATACASSAYAIAQGYELIKQDQADLVIVGGADSIINPEEIKGFNALYAISTRNESPETASRPFSADRDGFVIGEGAGILILEKESIAKKRNAKIYAELAGYALTSEAYNIMSPKTDGEGMAKTMEKALKHASVSKENIHYINAHGTSTTLNDKYETLAIEKTFEQHAKNIAISSSKSMLGHTIGAAGAIEAAITAMSVHQEMVHPTINLTNPDPELTLDYIPEGSRELKITAALSNSFAFGGHNACLVFKKI